MNKLLIVLFMFPFFAKAQKMPEIKAMNRVILHRGDTVFEFYTSQPPKKLKVDTARYYSWYRQDSIIVTQGGFAGKLLHGRFTVLFPNKNLMQEGYYKYGLKDGTWKVWNKDGELISTITWTNGKSQL